MLHCRGFWYLKNYSTYVFTSLFYLFPVCYKSTLKERPIQPVQQDMGISFLFLLSLHFFHAVAMVSLTFFYSSAVLTDVVHRKFLNSVPVNDIQTRSSAHTVLLIFPLFIQMSHLQCSWFLCRLLYFLHLCWIVTKIKYASLAYFSLDVTLFRIFTICLYCCFLPKYIFFLLAPYFTSPLHIQQFDILGFTNCIFKINETLMIFSLNF